MEAQQIDREILPFLSLEARTDLKCVALQYFLGLTGTEEGRKFIGSNDKYLTALAKLREDPQPPVAKDAYMALINLSTENLVAYKLLRLEECPDLILELLKYVMKSDSMYADAASMILSNLSRLPDGANRMVKIIEENSANVGFDKIILTFCLENHNTYGQKLHYLGPFLSNLTQMKEARKYILNKERCVIQRLLPFTQYEESKVRRGGIIATLKNCCFEIDYHEWLLSDAVDILPRLLLPLAGPEEFADDEMEKLPDDLQYLEPDKTREPDPDIRKMLVESVSKLCTLKKCRQYIKDKNTYVIMRELHKWEKDPAAKVAVENLVTLLISDEPEAGMEDLHDVNIPEDVHEKLDKLNAELEEDVKRETQAMEKGEGS